MGLIQKIKFIAKYPFFPFEWLKLKYTIKKQREIGKQFWVMQCDFKGHYPYLKSYFDFGKKFEDVEIYFTTGFSKNDSPKSFLIDQGVPPTRILEPIDLVVHTDWDVYLSPTGWGNAFPCNRNSICVQLFHTLADKNLEYGKNLIKFNVIFANGPVHHEFLDKYVFKPYPEAKKLCKIINTGFAKIDDLFDGTYSKNQIRKKFGIKEDDNRPIILYAPNWEATSALNKYGEDVFKFFSTCNYIIFIKLHYMSLLSREDHKATFNDENHRATDFQWTDWQAVLDKYQQFENIRIVQDQSLNPLMYLADVMVTDYGGASLEFLCMNKPIVYLDCPGFFKMRGEDIFENKSRDTGPIVTSMETLKASIEDLLNGKDNYAKKRSDMALRLLYNPGKAAETGFMAIYNMVKEKKSIDL